MSDAPFDYVVVGAGAAGCVLASRLSEDAAGRVALIEAGPDIAPGEEPEDIADVYAASYFNKAYFWPGLKGTWRAGQASAVGFPQARILGGGGSVMGMVALRGVAEDYEPWAAAGGETWGWDGVLPYFRKLESDWDYDGDAHGKAGPVPIRRLPRDEWPPLARAVEAYGRSIGLPYVADMNADFRDGYCSVPMSCTADRRASSAICYLTADVRRRANLEVFPSTRVDRIVFDGLRATGITISDNSGTRTLHAREVVLAAGAIFTPALLMRSGIGPGAHLNDLGIPVLRDVAGVGANLQNHPILFIGVYLEPHGRQTAALRTVPAATMRWSSKMEGGAPSDLYINVQSVTSWNALGRHVGNIAPSLLKPRSRGRIALRSARTDEAPAVDFNFLADASDVARLAQAYARAVDLALSAAVRRIGREPFPLRFTDRLRRLNERSRANAIATSLIARASDAMPALRGRIVDALTGEHLDLQVLARDDDRLAQHLRDSVAGVFHPVGTCAMGSVVDARGRVYGVEGLRVADASIMPTIPSGNTNIPTIMVAEKISAAIAAER